MRKYRVKVGRNPERRQAYWDERTRLRESALKAHQEALQRKERDEAIKRLNDDISRKE